MKTRRLAEMLLCALALAAPVRGGALSLALEGGALGEALSVSLDGPPSTPYLVLVAPNETPTPIAPGVILQIPTTFAPALAAVPGFLGTLDGAGQAAFQVTVPALPALDPLTLSFQAVAGAPPKAASNLWRLTPQPPDSIEATLEPPALALLGGILAPAADGSILAAGGVQTAAQRYLPALEEWEVVGVAPPSLPFGQVTALADGRLLYTGGIGPDGQPSSQAALLDPANLSVQFLTTLTPRAGHTATLLADGRVLVAGGFQAIDPTDLLTLFGGLTATTEIFDPKSGTFAPGPTMLEPRALHSATRASDGRVLIAGGLTLLPIVNVPTVSNTAYRFDPSSGSFGLPSFFKGPRLLHAACALENGRVLLAGGLGLDLEGVLSSGDLTQIQVTTLDDGQLFVPTFFGGLFQDVGGFTPARAGASAVPLQGGGVWFAGGFHLQAGAGTLDFALHADTTKYAGGGFQASAPLPSAAVLPLLAPLPDGTVLVGLAEGTFVYQP